jgi:2-dehydro-3-deoxygalactonokinase
MITSEIGLIELEHIKAPCGIRELAENIYETTMSEISDIPFVFIRGIKYVSGEHIDMMRGEETEIYGISEHPNENSLYVLPGSHSKLIYMDRDSRISEFSTELTGEMIHAIANHTILSSAVDLNQSAGDPAYLQKGYLASKEYGMNAALFQVRSLKRHAHVSDVQAFSFFIGAVLAPEIDNIIHSPAERVVIGGKPQLKEPTAMLLKMNCAKQTETVPEQIAEHATVYGAVRIYEASSKK